jgi:SsrA-binding protein
MAKKKSRPTKTIVNRRAKFDYRLGETFIAGLELTGAETKALRLGHGQLTGAYVTIKDNQLYVLNMTINGTNGIRISESDQTRTRRLLAKRREINQLIRLKQQGETIVPLELLTKGRFIKLKIASAQGKKLYDKRQTIKARDEARNIQAILKNR